MPRDKAADATALCTACGFCCDGTLFMTVPLREGESTALHRHALPVVVREDLTETMPQPCRALAGTACSVYPDRPHTCRAYRCRLLLALDEGEVSLDESLATVAMLRDAITGLQHLLPDGVARGKDRFLPRKWRRGDPPGDTHPAPADVEAYEAIEDLIDYRFRGRHGHR